MTDHIGMALVQLDAALSALQCATIDPEFFPKHSNEQIAEAIRHVERAKVRVQSADLELYDAAVKRREGVDADVL